MKVTQWFHRSVKPVHPGWYERQVPGGAAYWYFDGRGWRVGGFINLSKAYIDKDYSPDQDLLWRGLAEKP